MATETKLVIKQIANPNNPDVGIKYVGAKEYFTVKTGRDGKVITGVDEHALEIIQLPEAEKKKKSAEVKKMRESLETVLGKDLSPESNFWNEFLVVLEDDLTLDPSNPMDQLLERVLIANRYVAPSEEDIQNDERYHNAMFYIYRANEVLAKKAVKSQDQDGAIARLYSLSKDNPAKLKMIYSFIFGFDAEMDINNDEAYVKLKEYITNEESSEVNVKVFTDAVDKTPEELMTKQILDKAIRKKIVKTRRGSVARGDDSYGKSYEEALEYLSLPENSGELASLKKAVDR